ncbi:protein of unknown function [Acidithiobacillus ferrivorans]|uniref:Uncharacterized protein n=1 Tax=Acidithiobacillus ferrivorans TaxID=160808 RepID=A0ABY1MKA9_9PROT|nr:protein of unknown function [Acidithiobacillus ferrivorans]
MRIGNIGRGDLIHHFDGQVPKHALSADIEQLNNTILVSGNVREVGAIEYRVLQCPGFNQRLLVLEFGDALCRGNAAVGILHIEYSFSHRIA